MKREILAGVPLHSIVRLNDRWGVISPANRKRPRHRRVVDFWDGGREYVSDVAVVEVLPPKVRA